jgi:hypothetical protein
VPGILFAIRNSGDRRLSYGAASLHVGPERVRDHHVPEYGILGVRCKVAKVIFCKVGTHSRMMAAAARSIQTFILLTFKLVTYVTREYDQCRVNNSLIAHIFNSRRGCRALDQKENYHEHPHISCNRTCLCNPRFSSKCSNAKPHTVNYCQQSRYRFRQVPKRRPELACFQLFGLVDRIT